MNERHGFYQPPSLRSVCSPPASEEKLHFKADCNSSMIALYNLFLRPVNCILVQGAFACQLVICTDRGFSGDSSPYFKLLCVSRTLLIKNESAKCSETRNCTYCDNNRSSRTLEGSLLLQLCSALFSPCHCTEIAKKSFRNSSNHSLNIHSGVTVCRPGPRTRQGDIAARRSLSCRAGPGPQSQLLRAESLRPGPPVTVPRLTSRQSLRHWPRAGARVSEPRPQPGCQ